MQDLLETRNQRYAITSDRVNKYIRKMAKSDGIILGSPTYFGLMSPEMKALIDSAGFVARATPDMLKYKVGAAIVAVRRAGDMTTYDADNPLLSDQSDDCFRIPRTGTLGLETRKAKLKKTKKR